MSSASVRDAIKSAVEAVASPWAVFDLSDYNSLEDVLPILQAESVLLQYVVADDTIQTIGGEGNQGWEETGTVVIHLVVPTGFDSSSTVDKGDTIRTGLRGRRLTSDIIIESCSPFIDFGGGGVNGSTHTWVSNLFYVNRTCG